MIADVVNLAIMSIAFCHAAARLTIYRSFAAAISAVLTRNWVSWEMMRWESQYGEPNISVLTRDI
jgi:hypothetical protein